MRELTQQGRVTLSVAQTFGEVEVGHGEAVGDEVAVACKMRLKPPQWTAQLFGGDADGGLAFGRAFVAVTLNVHDLDR